MCRAFVKALKIFLDLTGSLGGTTRGMFGAGVGKVGAGIGRGKWSGGYTEVVLGHGEHTHTLVYLVVPTVYLYILTWAKVTIPPVLVYVTLSW